MPAPKIEKGTLRELVDVVQELSLAKDLDGIIRTVRKAARDLTDADGATFVLKDGEMSYYADEDAIAPLWKGCRFPMSACISGWSMMNRKPAVIEDIYQDPRIPNDLYQKTFVKSLVMVPIRRKDPIGAIGNYWAEQRSPTEEEVELLSALADITAVSIENVNIYNDLEKKVRERTTQLEAFSYSVAHDLKNPLAGMEMRLNSLDADEKNQSEAFNEVTKDLYEAIGRMHGMIDGLLKLSQLGEKGLNKEWTDMNDLVRTVADRTQKEEGGENVEIRIDHLTQEYLDKTLFERVWRNLISNSVKFCRNEKAPCIDIGMEERKDERVYFIKDNGCGFKAEKAHELFKAFRKLSSEESFPGSGIGLSMVQQIIFRHGGTIWAEGESGEGAGFFFTIPWKPEIDPGKPSP
ncbi:MAG: ATP-binding protein [Flavobacteriales bacterium]